MFSLESDSSREGQDDSFSTIQANNEVKNNRLKEMNNDLIKENQQLRTQFEEALELANELEPLHKKNQELAQEIQAMKAERDDLNHRLEISVAKIKERDHRLEEERRNRTIQQDTSLITLNKEVEKVKKMSKEQLDKVLDELSKSQQQSKNLELQIQMLNGRIDRLLQNGERFFQTKFNTVDDFIEYLDKPSQNVAGNDAVNSNGIMAGQSDRQLEKRLRKMKMKLHNAMEKNSSLEADLDRAIKENHQLKLDKKSELANLEVKLNEVREAKDNAETKLHQEVAKYENQLNQLRNELNNAKDRVADFPFAKSSQAETLAIRDIDAPVQQSEKKAQKADPNLAIFQQRVESLQEDLKKAISARDEATDKLRNFEGKYQSMSILVEKQKTDLKALNTQNEEQAKEIDSLRKALHAKSQPIQVKDVKTPKSSQNVLKYQRQIEDQKNQILSLNNTLGKCKNQVEKLEADVKNLEQRREELQGQLKRTQDDFAEYRAKAESKKPLTADDIIPPSAFHCPELEPQIAASIAKIANNPSLQPASKIQSCFKTIQTYYASQLQSIENLLKDSIEENKFLSTSLNKFIVDLSIAISDQPQTIDDFFKNGSDNLVAKVGNLRSSFDDLKHREEELQGIITRLAEAFGNDVNDPIAQIASFKNKFAMQREIIAKKTKKLHDKRRECAALAAAAKENDTRQQQAIEELRVDVSNVKNKADQLQKSNNTLNRENQRLQGELDHAVQQLAESEALLKDKTEDLIKKLTVENSEKVRVLTQKYNDLVSRYQSLNGEYEQAQNEIARINNLIAAQKRSIDAKEVEIRDLTQQMADKEQSAEARLQTEKRHITETYERAISQLKQQCEDHRCDVERMAKSVAEADVKVNAIKLEAYQAKKEMRRMEMELLQNNEKIERERKLLETSFSAKKISLESDYNLKLNNEKAKFEAEKRRICGFGAEAFKAFFNPNVEIDEKSYRCVIEQAKDELTRLAYSDAAVRRLVGARDNQTTDDAVAQLLLQKA